MRTPVIFVHLGRPKMLLGMKFSDAFLLGTFFYLGVMLSQLLLFSGSGLLVFYLKKKAERKLPKKYLWGLLYWVLPTEKFNTLHRISLPDSSKKKYMK